MNQIALPSRRTPGREPNGRLSRKKSKKERFLSRVERTEQDVMAVAIEYRQKVFGVPERLTKDQLAGSAIGRLALSRELHPEVEKTNRIMADAAFKYERQYRDYLMAISAPKQIGAQDLNAIPGVNNAENVEWKKRAIEEFYSAGDAIKEAQKAIGLGSKLQLALDRHVIEDQRPVNIFEIGSLREALNILVKHYRLG